MSYFSSLAQHNETKNAVAQHTQDAEQAVNDAKAAASQQAFQGFSQLLESGGGGTVGLAGGIHLTRKIYSKYKKASQAKTNAKNQKAQNDLEEKNQDAEDDKDADDELGEPEEFTEGSTKPASAEDSTTEVKGQGTTEETNTEGNETQDSLEKGDEADTDKQADDELGEPEDYELKTTGSAEDVKGSETQASQSEAPDAKVDDTVDNTQGADTIDDLKPETTEPSVMETDDVNNFRVSSANAQDIGQGDVGLQEPTQTTTFKDANPDNLGEEPDLLKGEDEEAGTTPADSELPDPVDYDIKSTKDTNTGGEATEVDASDQAETGGFKAGAETTDADEVMEGSADRVEQGAQMFSKITPTPSGSVGGLGLDASADAGDLATAGSSLLDSGLEIASTALDFLGPVGEIAGAGIALGGFFHSLFSKGEDSKESSEENATTDIAQGGGISSKSLQSAGQTTNMVGTTY